MHAECAGGAQYVYPTNTKIKSCNGGCGGSEIFGKQLTDTQLNFVDGISRYDISWEDICILMLTEKHNGITNYTIDTIPVLTRNICNAAIKANQDKRIKDIYNVKTQRYQTVREWLLEKYPIECDYLEEINASNEDSFL